MKTMDKDSLTGLYSSEAVKKIISEKLMYHTGSLQGYLAVIDISEYCALYEREGSLFVNMVMCTFADELKTQFPGSCIGRIGENEFVLYAENMSLLQLKERKKVLMKQIQRIYQTDVEKSSRIGVAEVQKEITCEELLLHAQSALYSGNGQDKGKVQIYRKGITPLLEKLSFTPIEENMQGLLHGTEEELTLFAVELFERVTDVKSALRVLSDIICRFYKVQEIVYFLQSGDDELKMKYYWGSIVRGEFKEILVDAKRSEWNILLRGYDKEGVAVLRQADIDKRQETDGKSILSIRLDGAGEDHYMLFVDREEDRDWQKERQSLKRLSWIIHKRLKQIENERRELEHTNYIIEHDDKTDLYNYTKFLSLAEQTVKSHLKKKYALIYSDFSNFQFLNETYGYATGDKVLIDFAETLKENCADGVLYSRVTGDHFISMHEYRESKDLVKQYVKVCDDFCERVNRKYNMCNLIPISGMSIIDDRKVKMAVYVDNANIARKSAKKHTSVRCEVYSEEMRQESKRRMELAANMENALKNGEFVMYLQPKVDLKSGKISGAEALVRWIKADGGMIYPDEFIPLFEKNGFITRVDFEMLRQVLTLQRSVMEQGKELIPISVNFSRRHQENHDYVEEVYRMMKEYGVPSEYVEIEVTESVFMDDFTVLNQNIVKLKKKGLMVAIDDFGSGYSSLNVLSKVNADVIKLDRQFLLSLESDSGEVKKNFLNTLILMIKQLGFKVLAEGVETIEQEELLRSTGCEYAQGYLYAKPMGVSDFMDYVKKYESVV